MGDSGAGKSETIEQIKVYGAAYIRDLITVYDDMGLLSLDEKGTVKTSGTEIGAFVRLDDLDAGYSFINENTGFINDYIKNEDLSVEEQKNRHMYVTNDGGKTFKIATINVPEEVTGILYIGAESMPYTENNILK